MVRSTSRFRRELLPSPAQFWPRELAPRKLSRPSRGWARTTCPLHGGKNPYAFAVNLQTGAFYCFNCQNKGGDIVAFIQLRDRVDFKVACMSLGAWETSDDPAILATLDNARRERESKAAELERSIAAANELAQQVRAELDAWVTIHTAAQGDLEGSRNIDAALDALAETIHPMRRAEAACALMAYAKHEDIERFAVDTYALESAVDHVLLTGWIQGDGDHWHEVAL